MNNNLSKELQRLLKLRNYLNRKRPKFYATGVWKGKKAVEERWRSPDGIHNKMRKKWKGKPKVVEVGYRGPKAVRGMHPSGYYEVLVYNVKDLESLDPKLHAIRIASTVGRKKRSLIIEEAEKRGLKILNP